MIGQHAAICFWNETERAIVFGVCVCLIADWCGDHLEFEETRFEQTNEQTQTHSKHKQLSNDRFSVCIHYAMEWQAAASVHR